MFGIHDFGLFLAAGILLNLTPGPDTAYILGRTVAQGREAGIASALGICGGSIFHTCAAGSWPVRITFQFGNCIRLYQTAWRRVPDSSWNENDHRTLKAIWPAAAFSAVHERCGISTRCSDKHAESESGVVLSRVPSPVYRPGFDYEGGGVSELGPHVCDHWHSLVPGSGVVCGSFQQTNTHKPNNWTMGQWNCRCALHFSRNPARNRKTMMRTQRLIIPTVSDFLHLTGY